MKMKENKIVIIINKIIKKMQRQWTKLKKLYAMSVKSKKKKEIYKVGFIVQLSSIWDKQVDVYEELQKRENVKVYLFVVPEYDFERDKLYTGYENNYFLENYKEAIKVFDEKTGMMDIKKYELDYLFYPRPYDHYLPEELRSEQMYKYTKCCYIPYAMPASDNFDDTGSEFFDNMYCLFMDTDKRTKLIRSRYPISYGLGVRKAFDFGYPVLGRYLDYSGTNRIKTIAWTPRWSMDPQLGGSNFMKYYKDFLELIENKKYKYIFRPHPLMFDELIKKGIIDEKFKEDFLERLRKNEVLFNVSLPIEELLKTTDLLITDTSSIIPQFFAMNRPIVYCEGGIPLNEDFREMMKYTYIANEWLEVLNYINHLDNGEDIYLEERTKFINTKLLRHKSSAKRIADEVVNGI